MIVRHVSSGGDAGYAVKRLVRGMCSSRESARQGFASCLAQVLSVLPEDEVSCAGIRLALICALHERFVGMGVCFELLLVGRLLCGAAALPACYAVLSKRC